MDEPLIDDGYEARRPVHRDNDAAMAEALAAEKRTTPEEHDAHHESAMQWLESLKKEGGKAAAEVFDPLRGITTIEDPELAEKVSRAAEAEAAQKAAAQSAPQSPNRATPDAAAQAHPDANAAAAGGAGEPPAAADASNADGQKKPSAEKPSQLEEMLANIRLNGERQQRIVITGDPDIEKRFLNMLAERKQLHYSGGAPVITISRDKALKLLNEMVAARTDGTEARHALSLSMERDSGGIVHGIKTGIANTFRRHNTIDVVVVGQRDVVEEKMKELGTFVTALEEKGHISKGVAHIENGKLVVREGETLKLKGNSHLYDVISDVQDKVSAYRRERSELQAELKAHKEEKDLKSMREDKAKAAPEAGEGKPVKPHERTAEIVAHMDRGFQDRDMLFNKNDKGQVDAMKTLHLAKGFKDPAEPELATLPTEQRQKAVVQLAALVAMASDGKFGDHAVKELDKQESGRSTTREKIDSYVAMEAKRDPAFAKNAEPILTDLVARDLITAKQAEEISGRIAELSAATKAEVDKEKAASDAATEKTKAAGEAANAAGTQATGQEASQEKAAQSAATASEASSKPESKSKDATSAATAEQTGHDRADASTASKAEAATEQKAGAASQAESKAQGADTASGLAAHSGSGSQTESSSQSASPVEPKSATVTQAEGAAPAAREQAAEPKAAVAEKPLELRDRIEALANEGPGKLTADKAHALVSELDGIRSKPLSALDAGDGNQPTQTLARAEALLKEMESGRLGAELKAQAKDLAEPLQKWVQQDDARRDAAAQATRVETPVAPTQTAPQAATQQAESAERPAPSAAVQAPAQQSAEQVAREQAAVRLTQTEAAYSKLNAMMDNPPGTFTHRDKSWNEAAIQRAADAVLRLDPDSVAKLSPEQQNRVTGYAAWVAEKADAGRLPGFASEEGKARVAQMVETAATLLKRLDGPLAPAVAEKLGLADDMVKSREILDAQAARTNSSPTQTRAADMVRQVFGPNEVSDANVKNMLKNGSSFTPAAVAELDPELRAKTVAALEHVAQSVRGGGLGSPFNKLPNGIQSNVRDTEKAVANLVQVLSNDPATKDALRDARAELRGELQSGNAADAKASSKQATQDTSVSRSDTTQSAGKPGGRGHDR